MDLNRANDSSKPKLYCAWFCGFAHRAWIAMLAKKVEFEYIEHDPYNKSAEWLAINPRGLIPTIVHNGNVIYESTVCVEYIDECWENDHVSLLGKDPYTRAHARIWGDFIGKKVVPVYFKLLMRVDPSQDEALRQELLENLSVFASAMDPEGPFFQGKELGYVDIVLAPWINQIKYILGMYRGFQVPHEERFNRYHKWAEAVVVHPCVAAVAPPRDKLLEDGKRYADNTAKTGVADSIRKGTPLP